MSRELIGVINYASNRGPAGKDGKDAEVKTGSGLNKDSEGYISVAIDNTTIKINSEGELYSIGGSGSSVWGNITGTLSNQTDLQNALNNKVDSEALNLLDNRVDAIEDRLPAGTDELVTVTQLNNKQDKLTAGNNISINSEGIISAVDTKYTAGTNISISSDNVISATGGAGKTYTAGNGISIDSENVIAWKYKFTLTGTVLQIEEV